MLNLVKFHSTYVTLIVFVRCQKVAIQEHTHLCSIKEKNDGHNLRAASSSVRSVS